MKKFTTQSLKSYLQENVLPKLDIPNPLIQEITEASGGLSSVVFRIQINNQTFYIKQVLEGKLAGLKGFPEDLAILFGLDRQQYEAKATELLKFYA